MLTSLQALDRGQRAAFVASLLGWTFDAFDFFLMVFVLKAIAADFHAGIVDVTWAVTLTLMLRPLGALVFGWLADRFGRRPVLMADVLLFSALELASAFAPSLPVLLVLRAFFGFAMGGEWGVGASLVMETVPPASRGLVSGILQEGYALGYLLAALVFALFYAAIGWRGMFAIGVLPALLVLFIRLRVKESPVWERGREKRRAAPRSSSDARAWLRRHGRRFLYVIAMMTAFNFFSHGTQDLYPTFLQAQHHLPPGTVGALTMVAMVGALVGGICFGSWSQRIGRRRAIVAAALLALPVIPLWAFSSTPLLLGLGAFLVQVAVQGAWGVVPAHLNELSPEGVRGTFPGFAYQLGNLLACANATLQAKLALGQGGNYALALAVVAGITAVVLALVVAWGPEAREKVLGT